MAQRIICRLFGAPIAGASAVASLMVPAAAVSASQSSSGLVQACLVDYKTVETAAEAFRAQVGAYPGQVPAGTVLTEGAAPKGIVVQSDILILMGTANGAYGGVVGPWLHSYPNDRHHFQIWFSDTLGRPFVEDARGTSTIPSSSTYTSADCSAV